MGVTIIKGNNLSKTNKMRHEFMDLPLPVPLLKNSSSAGRMGRGLSMGIQYLQEARSASTVKE